MSGNSPCWSDRRLCQYGAAPALHGRHMKGSGAALDETLPSP